ncbi:MAG: gliding motility-associated C-terminal domain-containing protein [Bacteroidia bacterium]|nr:gliding motility-associated C-terminal domain-containing protein [Bacteroidia bacterium]
MTHKRPFLTVLIAFLVFGLSLAQNTTSNNTSTPDEFPPLGTCSFTPAPNQHYTPSPQNGNGSLGQIFNMSKCGLNYTQATQRLGKRGSLAGVNQPAPYTITGIPVCRTIERAYIWASMSGTAMAFNVTIVNPLGQSFTFPAVNVGTGPDKCWGYGGTSSYRVDVTTAISGNGVYMISGFPTNPPTAQKDTDGATLFIIFSDPTANYQGHMVIHDGCLVGIGGNTAQTLTGINACANSIYARAFCMTGDWQLNGITGVWNGSAINIPWNWWNYNEVATTVTAAQATAAYSHAGLNDCYNWVVMGLYYRTNTCTTCPLPNSLTLTTTTIPATCANCNGQATVTATGGSAPYTYLWTPTNQTTQTATGLCAGTYTVQVTDATGCLSATTTVTITTTGGGLTLTPTITNALCNGQCNGSISMSVTGGNAPYTYLWTPGNQTGQTATGLCAGTYTVLVTDASGCTTTGTYTITQPTVVTLSQSQTNPVCNGQCTGTATVTASGGTPGYSYTWSPSGGNAATATGLCAGNYTVTVTDANGCTRTATYTITQPPALSASTSTTISTCGLPNGSATVVASGGTPGYTYLWSPSGATTATATGLLAGSYTVTITDANGCTVTAVAVVTAAGSPTIIITGSTNVSCFGGSNGSASTSTSGGTAPYTYSWSPSGGNSANATGLSANTYTVTVTDANGCSSTATVTITQPPQLTVSATMTPVLCNGGNTGTATATASGGTPGYSYAWSPSGGNAATATGLNSNTYTVTVTDANGCTATASITITQPTAVTATQTQVNVLCNGQCTGSGTVTASGGTPGYTYAWAPSGGNAATATGLCAGTYTCTITDANACTFNVLFTITQPTAMSATTSFVQATCGQSNGSATVTVTGGTPAYTYTWAPSGGNAATATGLFANTYTVTITDANGCTMTATVTVPNAASPNVSVSTSTNVSCFGGNNGSATVVATGGTAPYTYAWSPSGGNAATATGLNANTYTCVVTDANGCTTSTVVTITEPPLLTITAANTGNVLCNGGNTGSAASTPSGGTAPYTYTWTPSGGNSQNATGLTAGTYTVTVTDANGCTATATIVITEPPLLSVTSAGFAALCNGACNGQVVCIPAGGTQPFAILWTPGNATTASVNGLCAGTYTVLITDANGCTVTDTAIVSQPAPITATTLADTSHCNQPDGSVCVTPSGGTAPYTYNWNTVPAQTGSCATGLTPGQYCVTITDANGCTLTVCDNVPLALGVIGSITASSNATCFGTCDGSATTNASGGIGPYTYLWSPTNQTTPTATGLCAGIHICTVTDASGCTDTAVVTITEPSQLLVSTTTPSPICIGQCVTLTATITGGTPAYTTTWTPAGPNVCPTVTTTYTVNVTDANGCTTTAQTVTVTVNPPLTVSALVNPTAICIGATATLTATGNGGSGSGYQYVWNPGNLQGSSVNVSPASTTTYTVTLTDNCGTPSATATVTLTVNPLPVLAVIPPDSSCAPFCTTFTDLTPNAASWNWSFSGGTPSSATTSPTPQVCWTFPGTYSVTLTVTDNNGCSNSGQVSTVVVHPNPTAAFTASPDSVSVLNPQVCFTNQSILASTYWWDFGDPQDQNNNSTLTDPCHLYGDTGIYCIQLTATSQYGCADSTTHCIYVMPDFTLYVPNAFTPDENGINELFMPLGEGIDPDKFEMWIFDRWGNNIWYTQIWGKGWDGRANGGNEIAQEDVYVWKIVVYDYLGKKHAYVGHVSLIR